MLALLFCLLSSGSAPQVSSPQGSPPRESRPLESPPNLVIVLADDLGARDVAHQGFAEYYETPRIDQLAAQSVVFSRAYSNGPNCAPSRASLMSGLWTPRHGVYTVGSAERGKEEERGMVPPRNRTVLLEEFPTLAEVLHEHGYATGHFGKWHLSDGPSTQPEARGFDQNVGGNSAGHPKSYFAPYENPDLDDGPEGESLTERLTAEACRFVEEHRDRPFFLSLSHYAVHTPLQAREDRVTHYREKLPKDQRPGDPRYAAMVESVDQSLGAVLDTLERLGLRERTLVVFFSDNGGNGGECRQDPLRGAKGMLYEGGIRVPLSLSWPGVFPPRRCDEPVQGSDLFPTFLDAAGVAPEERPQLDGTSLLALAKDPANTLPPRDLYWHFPCYLEGENARGARDPHFRQRPASAVMRGSQKLIENLEDGVLELFDLAVDPGETTNLAAERPELAAELHRALVDWRTRTGAAMPVSKGHADRAP